MAYVGRAMKYPLGVFCNPEDCNCPRDKVNITNTVELLSCSMTLSHYCVVACFGFTELTKPTLEKVARGAGSRGRSRTHYPGTYKQTSKTKYLTIHRAHLIIYPAQSTNTKLCGNHKNQSLNLSLLLWIKMTIARSQNEILLARQLAKSSPKFSRKSQLVVHLELSTK